MSNSLVWLRNDLRLSDNPALAAAVKAGDSIHAVYIHETDDGIRAPGGAARWWLHQSLSSLGKDLAEIGVTLHVESGKTETVLRKLIKAHDIGSVHWNRRYAPAERDLDAGIKDALRKDEIAAESHMGNVLIEPWDIATGQGNPYSVYTPFWKTLKGRDITRPVAVPHGTSRRGEHVDTDYREPKWAKKLGQHWSIGEKAAHDKLDAFLEETVADYPKGRDFPAKTLTSRLSPHLRFGEISPRAIWHRVKTFAHAHHAKAEAAEKFLSELAWRDFNYHQLYHREDIAKVSMHGKYEGVRWRHAPSELKAWQTGQTGIPMVDAGMRELWTTGYMENRIRMLTASLLCKNLLIDWRVGEEWFWDCLVDGDEANNPGNWQWVAGSGMDASPFFRIFNPVTQGERFDADGDYVRQWVPELAKLPAEHIHAPDLAPKDVLEKAGVTIGKTYPKPIVDLKETRQRALDAVKGL